MLNVILKPGNCLRIETESILFTSYYQSLAMSIDSINKCVPKGGHNWQVRVGIGGGLSQKRMKDWGLIEDTPGMR